MIELTLPFAPSVNHYWKHCVVNRRPKVYLSEEAKRYKADVAAIVLLSGIKQKLTGRLKVTIYAHMPDKRKRDLDNLHKGVLDSLTNAGVWVDDEQIDELRIVRCGKHPGGKIMVHIAEEQNAHW